MKLALWILLALFLIGDAFFVLPLHISGDTVTNQYYINYKKDSLLLKNVFPDQHVRLTLNMPAAYETLYGPTGKKPTDSSAELLVNVSVFHNVDFTAVAFPFFKLTTYNAVVPFYSIIKASNEPDRDSTALIGNIVINGKISVRGICTPMYARAVVEKDLAGILKKEMQKIEADINRPPDTSQVIIPEPAPIPTPVLRPVRRKRR